MHRTVLDWKVCVIVGMWKGLEKGIFFYAKNIVHKKVEFGISCAVHFVVYLAAGALSFSWRALGHYG